MQFCHADFAALPWETPASNVRYKVQRNAGQQMRLVEFGKGFAEADWCRKGHIGYVLEGSGELAMEGRTVPFQAGDGFFIPPGEEYRHKLHVYTEVLRVFLVEES
jgi:quercetin dioxygenase-like cupin family protein